MSFSQAVADEICTQLAEGKSLRAICRQDGMPSTGAFLLWVSQRPALADQYTRARMLCLDAMAEDILDIADTPQMGTKEVSKATGLEITTADMVEHRRLQIEARKWLMGKMAPKKYGDKLAIGGADDLPPIKTLSDEQLAARVKTLQDKLNGAG